MCILYSIIPILFPRTRSCERVLELTADRLYPLDNTTKGLSAFLLSAHSTICDTCSRTVIVTVCRELIAPWRNQTDLGK